MATYTTNYNLKKPALTDKIRIADFNGNADTIDATMYDNATLIASLKSDIGIVENTNTATHNISAGQYVIWKGLLYTASSAISSGATLSDANLTAVSGGGLNSLSDQFTNKTNKMFQYIDEKYVSANGTFTFSIEGESHLAFVFVNFGNNTQAFYIIGSRNNYAELTIQPVVQSSYLSLTNNQYTITGTCTYAARVFIYRT